MSTREFFTPTRKYHVTEHGNGWAYEIVCESTNDYLWFQDSDADAFRENTGYLSDEDAIRQYFDALGD